MFLYSKLAVYYTTEGRSGKLGVSSCRKTVSKQSLRAPETERFLENIARERSEWAMFIGEYIHTIDHKRRLAIPSKFRKYLGERAIIAQGLDNCLVVYPVGEWEKKAAKLENLPDSQMSARTFSRIILSGANEVELDNLGRVLVPEHLRKYAALKKNVAVIGLSNRMEVWDKEKWQEYKTKMEKTVEEFAQQLGI